MLIRDILAKNASRRLRRARGEGGAAERHRGRQQPAGAAYPAARCVTNARQKSGAAAWRATARVWDLWVTDAPQGRCRQVRRAYPKRKDASERRNYGYRSLMRSAAHRASIIWLTRWGEMPNSAAASLCVAPAATRAAMARLRASYLLLRLLLRFFL